MECELPKQDREGAANLGWEHEDECDDPRHHSRVFLPASFDRARTGACRAGHFSVLQILTSFLTFPSCRQYACTSWAQEFAPGGDFRQAIAALPSGLSLNDSLANLFPGRRRSWSRAGSRPGGRRARPQRTDCPRGSARCVQYANVYDA
jgi:hypothetical protein